MDVTADRSMTRWTLSSHRASDSARLSSGVVFQSTAPATVHTVVSGWGRLNATVMTDVPKEHRGDQSVSIMVQLPFRGYGGDKRYTAVYSIMTQGDRLRVYAIYTATSSTATC